MNSFFSSSRVGRLMMSIAMIAALAACGGGGGGDKPTTPPPEPKANVSGVAAVGLPIVDGTVTVKCSTGFMSTFAPAEVVPRQRALG